jgi:hypothetical protein
MGRSGDRRSAGHGFGRRAADTVRRLTVRGQQNTGSVPAQTAIEPPATERSLPGIIEQLSLTPDDGSITVGFAQLAPGDSPMDLIDRADRQLIEARNTRTQEQAGAAPKCAGNEQEPGDADSDADPQSAT